jgi:hypothetical protein
MRCPRARAQELMKLATAAVIDYGRKLPEAVCAPLQKKYSQLSGLLACVPAACTAHALCVLYFFNICICGSRVAVRTPHAVGVQRPKFRQLLVSLVSATSKTTSTSRSGFGLWSTRCMEPTRRRKSRTRRPQSPRRSCVRCAHQWLVYWDWFGFHLLWIVDLAEIAVYIMDAHFAQCTYHLRALAGFGLSRDTRDATVAAGPLRH